MAGQPGREQSSFASGELGDLLAERKNLKYYRTGLARAENLVVTPQGPATNRPYTRQISRRRHILAGVPLAGAALGAPVGGTAVNAVDSNTATRLITDAIASGDHVVFTLTLDAPAAVSAVDVNSYRISAGSAQIGVEYQVAGGAWVELNGRRKLIAADRSRRFCTPPQAPVTASAWRVVARGIAEEGSVEITEFVLWAESASYGPGRVRSFAFSRAAAYDIVVMAGHGDVYAAEGGWLTGFALPHGTAEVNGRWRQRLNTALLFSPSRQPWRIFRENADYEWQCGAAPLKNLPLYDFGDVAYTNGVAAVWRLNFVNTNFITLFTVTVGGEETGSMLTGVSGPETALVERIEALDNIEPGVTAEVTSWGEFGGFATVTFGGEDNIGPVVINSARVLNKPDAAVSWSRQTRGRLGGEAIFSGSRGWPTAGIFFQQRLLLAGSPQLPNAIGASMTGDFFQFNTDLTADNAPFVALIDAEEDEKIEEFVAAGALMMFTSRAEYWFANSALSKDQPLTPREASTYGCAPGVPVAKNGGRTLFIAREGSTLCEFRYNDVDQSYKTDPISLLAPHLVQDVVDLALQRPAGRHASAILAMVQADGAMRLVCLERDQDVTGMARVTTDGAFRAACVNAANRITVLVDRNVGGQTVQFVERFEDGLLLDQAVDRTVSNSASVTGLTDHEDRVVWAICEGKVFGPFTVNGGAITLPEAVDGIVTVGRWTPFLADTLPPSREIGPEIVTQSNVGFHTVRVSVADTTSLAIGANGQPVEDVPLFDFGMTSDVAELNAPFTGLRQRDGIVGDQERPSMRVTQLRPGRITLRSIVGEGDF